MTEPLTIEHSDREHSSLVGGSTADRRLSCPGSWQMEAKVAPELKGGTSNAAEEGTALHEAMEFILANDITDARELLHREFNGYLLDDLLIGEALVPCVEWFDQLDAEAEAEGGLQFLVEKRCQMPGIPGAFGTSDIIARTDKRSVIADWKFGAGVPVKASYIEEDGKVHINSQLLFYGRSAMYTHPEMFEKDRDWPVDLYIIQPRSRDLGEGEPIYSKATVTVGQLEDFRMALVSAIAEAKGENPRTRRGPWCRFADCKIVCPHHTGPMLDLGKLDLSALQKNKPGEIEPVAKTDWGKLFALYLPVCDAAEEVIKTIRAQAHNWLEQGHSINDENDEPVYKLVPKRATESYTDKDGMRRHAIGLGLSEDDIVEPAELKSPAQMRAAMEPLMEGATKKARTEEAKKQIGNFTANVSSGTTLARADDNRPDVTPTPRLVSELAKKLGAL